MDLQERMRNELIHIGKWNLETLWELLITLPLFDQEELAILINSILNQEIWNDSTIELLASILVAYTQRLYNEKNITEVKKFIKIIKQLPTKPSLMLHKMIASYYSDLIDKSERAEKIIQLLRIMNYQRFLGVE